MRVLGFAVVLLFSSLAQAADPPNILFCIADDASWAHVGAYGCSWVRTPGFDRVAREGVLFTNAYTPNAKCAPSRACILTGRNPWQLKAAANHIPFFPAEFKTYAEFEAALEACTTLAESPLVLMASSASPGPRAMVSPPSAWRADCTAAAAPAKARPSGNIATIAPKTAHV